MIIRTQNIEGIIKYLVNETHKIPKGKPVKSRTGTFIVNYTDGTKRYFKSKSDVNAHLARLYFSNNKKLDDMREIKKNLKFSKDEKEIVHNGNIIPYYTLSDKDIDEIAGSDTNTKEFLYRWRQQKMSSFIGR